MFNIRNRCPRSTRIGVQLRWNTQYSKKQRCYPIINDFNALRGILEKSDHHFWTPIDTHYNEAFKTILTKPRYFFAVVHCYYLKSKAVYVTL